MKIYVLMDHYEPSDIFVTKELAYKELKKQRKECSLCCGNAEKAHTICEEEAK